MQYSQDTTCPQHEILKTLANLGKCCQYTGRLEEALRCYRRALQLKAADGVEKESWQIQLLAAEILYDIGLIHSKVHFEGSSTGLEKSLQSFLICLDIRKRCFGECHPAVANVQHNIGTIFIRRGDLVMAKKYIEASLKTRRDKLASCHPEVASSLRHLAMVYTGLGMMYGEAECLLTEAIAILRTVPGDLYLRDVLIELAYVKRMARNDQFSVVALRENLPKERRELCL